MSTLSLHAGNDRTQTGGFGQFLAKLHEAIASHRQAKAEAFVRPYLARLSDDELKNLGMGPDDIAKVRAANTETLPYYL